MAQKRRQYVKLQNGSIEEQLIASSADIVAFDDTTAQLGATDVQTAIEKIKGIADTGGVTSVNGQTGSVTLVAADIGLGNVTNDEQVKRSEMGEANGVATLDGDGKVPSSQLPSYVDDVLEYNAKDKFPATGESSKIYVSLNDNKTYRWSGSQYVEISSSLTLGETNATAYAGDKGKANAEAIAALQKDVSANKTYISGVQDGSKSVPKAEKLATSRKIEFKQMQSTVNGITTYTGDVTGEISFDGSKDVSTQLTLANSGVAAGTYSAVKVDAKGRVTQGNQMVEWGNSDQNAPTTNLAIGGLFFKLIG